MPEGPPPSDTPMGETPPPIALSNVVKGHTYRIRTGRADVGLQMSLNPGTVFRVVDIQGRFLVISVPSRSLRTVLPKDTVMSVVEVPTGARRRTRKTRRRMSRRRR